MEIQDNHGHRLAGRRLPEAVAGIAALHALVTDLLDNGEPIDVVVGIETDRGPWVQALIAAGYGAYAINPLSVARYRERHVTSGAKSDAGDAKVLADLMRTDRHQHRPIAGDSELAEAVKVLARAHQNLIWSRQRQANALRSTLREFYPAALAAFDKLAGRDALAVLEIAPTPAYGRAASRAKLAAALRRAGRQRNIDAQTERMVLARYVANKRLRDALYLQAFAALNTLPGARTHYDAHRARGNTHHQALRALANRLVDIIHGCLHHRQPYNEAAAWAHVANRA